MNGRNLLNNQKQVDVPPVPGEKRGREANAKLFAGIVRETQMRPGSPLFKTESYKQDSTSTIRESLHD
jgi:hypothetical protein